MRYLDFNKILICVFVVTLSIVAVIVTFDPGFFAGSLKVPVVPSGRGNVCETRDCWRGRENTAIQFHNQLHELSPVGEVTAAEPGLCLVEVARVNETHDGILVPDTRRNVAVRSKHRAH